VAAGDAEVYGYEGCVELAINNLGASVNHPDCVMLYALCKLVCLANSAENMHINERKPETLRIP